MSDSQSPGLQRHFGLLQATALNVTMIVGAGVFATIPFMRKELPGHYLLLGWLLGAALMLLDGLVWAELGAAMPGSGGSYVYLLESYGRSKWGRVMAFLFIWQFIISGPLELASGLIAMGTFAGSLTSGVREFNELHSASVTYDVNQLMPKFLRESDKVEVGLTIGPTRVFALAMGGLMVFLLYRRITALSKLTVTFWLGVLGIIAWVLIDGAAHGRVARSFDSTGAPPEVPKNFAGHLSACVMLAMYSYLGYYNVCYIGDEVRNPGRTIPRAILLSAVLVATLFAGLHLAMTSVVPWQEMPTDERLNTYSLPADMMRRIHGEWAATLITLMLVWSCFGSAFAGMLGYARIPYGAARQGHFYAALARVHPNLRIPHVSLLVIGVLTLFWSFFDLGSVISIMIITRIVEQFVAQIVGVMILRKSRPDMPRPYRIWLYPLPCLLALAGWLTLYVTSAPIFIVLGLLTLAAGVAAFLVWSRLARAWPFGPPEREPAGAPTVS